jgi:hypothetical protein
MANPNDGTVFGFGWATARMAVGGGPAGHEAADLLLAAGVTHVLYLRRDGGDALLLSRDGLFVKHNPAADDGEYKDPLWFRDSLSFALDVLARPGTKLLVMCWHGLDRAPATAHAILLALGLGPRQAWEMVERARPGASGRYTRDARDAVRILGYCAHGDY